MLKAISLRAISHRPTQTLGLRPLEGVGLRPFEVGGWRQKSLRRLRFEVGGKKDETK
jgi:hypothetical protein